MVKNAIIVFLLVALVIAGYYAVRERGRFHSAIKALSEAQSAKPTPPRIPILTKGMKLSVSPISKFAYKIAPGGLSDDAKKVLNGFNIISTNQADGSVLVSLSAKDSGDMSQQYTVKKGNTLYFVEMSSADDKDNKDLNLRDDYGIIVDSSGIVQ